MAYVGTIDGRKVYLSTGEKTQAVRVRDLTDQHGQYEWVFRVVAPNRVTPADVAARTSLNDLREWLTGQIGAAVELEATEPQAAPPPAAKLISPSGEDAWIAAAVEVVERTLDQLLAEFLRTPYLHRVEHSLHTRLVTMLTAHPPLSGVYPLPLGSTVSQAVHKEWPETIPAEDTRRGNFDVAVIAPGTLARCNLDQFLSGRLEAPIVIEVGLDYGLTHLAQDADKLLNSKVQHGYLVHFTRKGHSPKTEEFVHTLVEEGRLRVVYASIGPLGRCKRAGGSRVADAVIDTDSPG